MLCSPRVLLPAALALLGLPAPAGAVPGRDPSAPAFVLSEVHDRYERVAPDALSSGTAATSATMVFQDGFESGMGNWTVTDDSGAGAQWSDADCWAASGTRSAACAAGGTQGIPCGADYPADMKTWMVHGPIDLSDSTICEAELEFTVDLDTEPGLDGLFAAVSTDGVHFSGIHFTEPTQGTFIIDLAPQVGSPQVWIGFRFHSDGSIGLPDGARLDDVILRRKPGPPVTNARYGFTLSYSGTDPRVHTAPPGGGSLLYLWFTCDSQGGGFSALEISLIVDRGTIPQPPAQLLSLGTFLVTGDGSGGYTLTSASCPPPPVPLALVFAFGSGQENWGVCVNPCSEFSVLSCDPTPARYAADFIGVSTDSPGQQPCQSPSLCGAPTPVENRSWGAVKALYR